MSAPFIPHGHAPLSTVQVVGHLNLVRIATGELGKRSSWLRDSLPAVAGEFSNLRDEIDALRDQLESGDLADLL